jgi:hypothetical protein
VTVDSPPWKALRRISAHIDKLKPIDRELLRPALHALEGGEVMALPEYVLARIRDIDARLPKSQQ